MTSWFVNVRLRAEAVFNRFGSWWQPGSDCWVYAPRHQAFWQDVLDIPDKNSDADVWSVVANLPEMVTARTTETRAEAEANVWRLLVGWAAEPVPGVPMEGEDVIVWAEVPEGPVVREVPVADPVDPWSVIEAEAEQARRDWLAARDGAS